MQDFANYHISRDRYVPLCYQLYYAIEMLRIFDYMHRLRIIHCDVSLRPRIASRHTLSLLSGETG